MMLMVVQMLVHLGVKSERWQQGARTSGRRRQETAILQEPRVELLLESRH